MKGQTEYSYNNRAGEKPYTVFLTEYNLVVHLNGKERSIPYANITSVRLCRSRNKFSAIVQPDGESPLTISNKFYGTNNQCEDRSRQYSTFVRILHFHLRGKSAPEYVCGKNLSGLVTWACILVVVSFALAIVLNYLELSPISTAGLGLLTSGVALFILGATSWGRFPNIYKPDEIPFQFLPQ